MNRSTLETQNSVLFQKEKVYGYIVKRLKRDFKLDLKSKKLSYNDLFEIYHIIYKKESCANLNKMLDKLARLQKIEKETYIEDIQLLLPLIPNKDLFLMLNGLDHISSKGKGK